MLIFLTVEVLVSSPTTTVTIGDPSVNLRCEVYGYLMRQPSIITWNFGNEVLMDDSVFTITVQDGSHMIQNGGDTPQPSVKSVLTIDHPNRTHEGPYICSMRGGFNGLRVITLQVMEGRSIVRSSNTVHVSYSLWKHVCSYTQVVPYEGCVLKDRIINGPICCYSNFDLILSHTNHIHTLL